MNSNWGYQWAPSLTSNPCSESYPGAEAFEAVETKAVADYLTGTPNDVRAFIDVHSYGQLCMCGTRTPLANDRSYLLCNQSCSPTRTRAPTSPRTPRC